MLQLLGHLAWAFRGATRAFPCQDSFTDDQIPQQAFLSPGVRPFRFLLPPRFSRIEALIPHLVEPLHLLLSQGKEASRSPLRSRFNHTVALTSQLEGGIHLP